MTTGLIHLDPEALATAADMLKAMAHPMRIAIINLLHRQKRLSVTEIFEQLGIEQAAASNHLRILKDRGILLSERDGKHIYYSLKHDRISQIIACLEKCQA